MTVAAGTLTIGAKNHILEQLYIVTKITFLINYLVMQS